MLILRAGCEKIIALRERRRGKMPSLRITIKEKLIEGEGNLPIFVIARKDAALTKQSRSLAKNWIASTPLGSRNDDVENYFPNIVIPLTRGNPGNNFYISNALSPRLALRALGDDAWGKGYRFVPTLILFAFQVLETLTLGLAIRSLLHIT
jgi:hypothetical protein